MSSRCHGLFAALPPPSEYTTGVVCFDARRKRRDSSTPSHPPPPHTQRTGAFSLESFPPCPPPHHLSSPSPPPFKRTISAHARRSRHCALLSSPLSLPHRSFYYLSKTQPATTRFPDGSIEQIDADGTILRQDANGNVTKETVADVAAHRSLVSQRRSEIIASVGASATKSHAAESTRSAATPARGRRKIGKRNNASIVGARPSGAASAAEAQESDTGAAAPAPHADSTARRQRGAGGERAADGADGADGMNETSSAASRKARSPKQRTAAPRAIRQPSSAQPATTRARAAKTKGKAKTRRSKKFDSKSVIAAAALPEQTKRASAAKHAATGASRARDGAGLIEQLKQLQGLRSVLSDAEFEAAKARILELNGASSASPAPGPAAAAAATNALDAFHAASRGGKRQERARNKSRQATKNKELASAGAAERVALQDAQNEMTAMKAAMERDVTEREHIAGELAASADLLRATQKATRKRALMGKMRSAGVKSLLQKRHTLREAVIAKKLENAERKVRVTALKDRMRAAGAKAVLKKKMAEVQHVLKDHAKQTIEAEKQKMVHAQRLKVLEAEAAQRQVEQHARHEAEQTKLQAQLADVEIALQQEQKKATSARRMSALKRATFKMGSERVVAKARENAAVKVSEERKMRIGATLSAKWKTAALKTRLDSANERLTGAMELIEQRFGSATETVLEQHLRETELMRELEEARRTIEALRASEQAEAQSPRLALRGAGAARAPPTPPIGTHPSASGVGGDPFASPILAPGQRFSPQRGAIAVPILDGRARTARLEPTGEFAGLERSLACACDSVSAVALRAAIDEADARGYASGSTRLARRLLAEIERSRRHRAYGASPPAPGLPEAAREYSSVVMTRLASPPRAPLRGFGGYGVLSSVRG